MSIVYQKKKRKQKRKKMEKKRKEEQRECLSVLEGGKFISPNP